MKKRGFTLIELLAVIVILAIIALIVVPTIMNIINKANKSAFKDSAYGIIDSGELYYAKQLLELNNIIGIKKFEFPNDITELGIKGKSPKSGSMKINKDGRIVIAISNGKYCIKKGYNDSDITIDEDIDNCQLPSILKTTNNCIKNSTICSNGTKVNVKVNSSENYDFYVIKDTGTELTLIMDRNLGSNVAWINEADYIACGGTSWTNAGNNEKGPLTALKELEANTSGWSNIPSMTYTLTDDGGTNRYLAITRSNVKARMLNVTEASSVGCTTSVNSCPNYITENLIVSSDQSGYWLSSSGAGDITAPRISYSKYYNNKNVNVAINGVHPVITVSKDL